MHIVAEIMMGVAANLDNMIIGISYGLSGRRMKWMHNAFLALISGGFSAVAGALARLLIVRHTNIAAAFGTILLIVMGVYTIVDGFRRNKVVTESNKKNSWIETFCLGVILGINCVPVSFGAGLSSVPWPSLSLTITICSFIFVAVGNYIGYFIRRRYTQKWINVISGVLLIITGVIEYLM